MNEEADLRRVLADYLLGKLSEAEREQLADRYFEDDALFDQLLEAENDLLDRYVRNQLHPNDRHRFELYVDKLPDGRHEVAVATALLKAIPAVPTAAEAVLSE
jgi:uncharacterized protein (DUF2236 family)